jgi:putative DNA primase/helicase
LSLKSPFLNAALAAANAEFRVFPVAPATKVPAISDWQRTAGADRKTVQRLWRKHPNANIGVVTGGEAGLFVLDVDGDQGRASLKALEGKFGQLPSTVSVRTPTGSHYYFRCNKLLRNSAGKLAVGLDGRGEGGYVVGAGSMRFGTSGESLRYRYAKGRSPDEIEIAEIPPWLLTLLEARRADAPSSSSEHQSDIQTSYAAAALRDEAAAVRRAAKGKRNHRLNTAAFNLGQLIAQGDIDVPQVEEVLTSAALGAGLEPDEIRATLESGLTKGQASPRNRNGKKKKRTKDSLRTDPLLAELSKLGESDTDNAQRLLKRYGNHLRFVPERQRWFAFDERTWHEDTGGQHISFGQRSARLIANEAGLLNDGECSRKRQDWGLQSLGSGRVKSALEMARPHATRSITEFDADPWLLNVRNGTLDLRTSELRPYDPADYLTRLAGTTYDPEAKCPRFRRFLREIFADDEELIGFLRRYVGYTLTGSTREQCFLFLQGEGKNGKSTLIAIVQEMLGDYARTVPKGTLLAKFKASSISNDLARLAGARMVSAIESNPNEQLDEALVKQITGGDRLAARFLYSEFFEFTPELKLWYAANHPPRLRSTDDALWRRITLLHGSAGLSVLGWVA